MQLDARRGIRVDGERRQEPTTLAADIQRFVAENGRRLSGSMLAADDDAHGAEGPIGDAAP